MGRASAFSYFDAFAATSYKIPRYRIVAAQDRINTTRSTIVISPTMKRDAGGHRPHVSSRTNSISHILRRNRLRRMSTCHAIVELITKEAPSTVSVRWIYTGKRYKCVTDIKWLVLHRQKASGKWEESLDSFRTDAGWAKLGWKLRHLARGAVDLTNQ